MVAFFLFPSALADQRLYQAGFMAPSYQNTYVASPQMYAPAAYAPSAADMYGTATYAYPEAYPVYEQEASDDAAWSDVAMLAVAGAVVGAAIGYKTQSRKVNACGNAYCTCGAACQCGAGCQCGKPVSMLGVSGREATLADKFRNAVLAGLVSVGVMSTPVVANADATVKLGSDGGQLVFVPDEVKIKAGESVSWVGNKGMPHNVVFDEDEAPSGADLAALNHEDMINEEGEKVTSKFTKPGTYPYYCEPHRGAGMNGTVVVQ
jgi:plastocyanin